MIAFVLAKHLDFFRVVLVDIFWVRTVRGIECFLQFFLVTEFMIWLLVLEVNVGQSALAFASFNPLTFFKLNQFFTSMLKMFLIVLTQVDWLLNLRYLSI